MVREELLVGMTAIVTLLLIISLDRRGLFEDEVEGTDASRGAMNAGLVSWLQKHDPDRLVLQ